MHIKMINEFLGALLAFLAANRLLTFHLFSWSYFSVCPELGRRKGFDYWAAK